MGAGFSAIVAGWAVGMAEISGLGIACVALPLVSLLIVALRSVHVEVVRNVSPDMAIAGESVVITVRAVSTGPGRTPIVIASETIEQPGTVARSARIRVRALAAGESDESSYRLDTERRGLCEFGPMRLTVTDPCGLARRHIPGPEAIQLLVLPRVDSLLAPWHLVDDDEMAASFRSMRTGSEFASLRDYESGDDLRKVHWPSSARKGALMVRRDELLTRPRCTVVLDIREEAHVGESLERCVSAAASVLLAGARGGQEVRLRDTSGFDSGNGSGQEHLRYLLAHLAVAQVDPHTVVPDAIESEVLIGFSTSRGVGTMPLDLARGFRVSFDVARDGPTESTASADEADLRIGPDQRFDTCWNRMLLDRSAHAGVLP